MARIALSRPNRSAAADADPSSSLFNAPWLLDEQVLAETLGLAQLLPEAHAAYRPLLVDGLRFFLERLPPPRQARILTEQLRLPGHTSPARRLVTLLRQCPTLHKMGQVVARDQRRHPAKMGHRSRPGSRIHCASGRQCRGNRTGDLARIRCVHTATGRIQSAAT